MSSADNCIRICVFILLLISVTLGFREPINNSYDSHKREIRSSRHYCGNNLVRALHFLCESYNKRSSVGPLFRHSDTLSDDIWNDNEMLSSDDPNERPRLSLFALLNNHNDMNHFHRAIRGVVDECCRRSCSTSQLSQYCGQTRVTTTTAPPLIE